MSASLLLANAVLAYDGKTLTAALFGGGGAGYGPAANLSGFTPKIASRGGAVCPVASSSVTGSTLTLTLAAAVGADETLTLDVSAGANLTDSGGNTAQGQAALAVTNQSQLSAARHSLPNPAIRLDGRDFRDNGNGYYPLAVGATMVVWANAAEASILAIAFAPGKFWVSVDDGAEIPVALGATGADCILPVLTGVVARWHKISVRAESGQYFKMADFLSVLGGTGAIRAVDDTDGYGPVELLGSAGFGQYGDHSAWQATGEAGYVNPIQYKAPWPNAVLRRRVQADGLADLKAWAITNGASFTVYLDGVKIGTTALPDASAGGAIVYRWHTLASGVNLAGGKELWVVSDNVGNTFNAAYIDALMLVGAGAQFPAQAVPARKGFVAWGDSKTFGSGVADKSTNLCGLILETFGALPYNFGVPGDTEQNAAYNRAGQLTGASPAPAFVLDRFGHNDGESVGDFQAAVARMISLARGAYPGAKILVCGVENSTQYDGATQAARTAAKQAAVAAANDPGVEFIDMTGVINPAAGQDTDDGVHENARGYQKDFARLRPYLAAALGVSNTAPTIAAPGDQSVAPGQSTGALAVTLGGAAGSNPAALTLSAHSSDQSLIPDGAIALGGGGANRTVAVAAPSLPPQTVTITLTAADGAGSQTSASFALTVNPNPTNNNSSNHPFNAPMTFTTHNSAVSAANLSQQILAGNASRAFYFLQNCSVHPMYVGVGAAATKNGGSIQLRPGEHLDWSMLPTTQAIHVLSPNAGGAFTLLEA